MQTILTLLSTFVLILAPTFAFGHEVYVLQPDTIRALESAPAVSFFDIFLANTNDIIIWGVLIGFLIVSVFIISISATLENKFDKYLVRIKKYAPFIARITAGLAFIACAYNAAVFGPELPMSDLFGSHAEVVRGLFYILGASMIFGVFTRLAGLIGLLIFAIAIAKYGTYMLTYANYFAEFLVLILVGGHKFHISDEKPIWWRIPETFNYLSKKYGEFAFLILRIGFGVGLIYSSVYAKILHNQLALAVVNEFGLIDVFGFSAEFIVFGAALIEILLGVFIILGIEIRFNAIVLNVFLTLSLLYFGESVWPHIVLIGLPIAFFCYGYDKYSLEGYFFKKGNREPIF